LKEPVLKKIIVEFDPKGALATTYLGQGSAMGLAGGLLGIEMTDPRLVGYEKLLEESDLSIEYLIANIESKHPSAYKITMLYPDGEEFRILGLSTGGGMIEIIDLNGYEVSIKGDYYENLIFFEPVSRGWEPETEQALKDEFPAAIIEVIKLGAKGILVDLKSRESLYHDIASFIGSEDDVWHTEIEPLLPVLAGFDAKLPFTTIDQMLDLAQKENQTLSELAIGYECARSGLSPDAVLNRMQDIVNIVQNSIEEGLKGTTFADRLLGQQSHLIREAEQGGLISPSVHNSIIAFTSAIMEVKSSMGIIVAIPTAGSCGVLGGALFGTYSGVDVEPERFARGFMAAGIIGVFIDDLYTFSAEEGGCQVECGAASAMAAAALVEMAGGNADQAAGAASLALQNLLGLICDPVARRVEVPCLGKNILGATNAHNAAIMAISGFDHLIPLEEVILTMNSVGQALPSSLCCTGLGGLAQTPYGRRLDQIFNPS
jgi:L-serine dehydratase